MRILIVTALKIEADITAKALGLHKVNQSPIRYQGEFNNLQIDLLVSGMGGDNCLSALNSINDLTPYSLFMLTGFCGSLDKNISAGHQQIKWIAHKINSGFYMARLKVGSRIIEKKIMLIK